MYGVIRITKKKNSIYVVFNAMSNKEERKIASCMYVVLTADKDYYLDIEMVKKSKAFLYSLHLLPHNIFRFFPTVVSFLMFMTITGLLHIHMHI